MSEIKHINHSIGDIVSSVQSQKEDDIEPLMDISDTNELRRAIIISEILNRKY